MLDLFSLRTIPSYDHSVTMLTVSIAVFVIQYR